MINPGEIGVGYLHVLVDIVQRHPELVERATKEYFGDREGAEDLFSLLQNYTDLSIPLNGKVGIDRIREMIGKLIGLEEAKAAPYLKFVQIFVDTRIGLRELVQALGGGLVPTDKAFEEIYGGRYFEIDLEDKNE